MIIKLHTKPFGSYSFKNKQNVINGGRPTPKHLH